MKITAIRHSWLRRLPVAAALLLSVSVSPALTLADWTSITATGGAGVIDGVSFTASWTFTGGAYAAVTPQIDATPVNGDPMNDPAYYLPSPPIGTETFLGAWGMHNSGTEFVDMTLTFASPVSDLRLLFGNVDWSIWQFTPGSVSLIGGSADTVYNPITGQLSDSNPGTVASPDQSGNGTLLVNGGAPVTSLSWRMIDNPSHPNSEDGNFWTVAAVPEPTGVSLLGLGALLMAGRRKRN